MFASRVGTNLKYVARLSSLLEVALASKNTVNNPFLGLGHAVEVSLAINWQLLPSWPTVTGLATNETWSIE
jgi:hypothetical protein